MGEARDGFEWTDTTLDRLRTLWDEGHSTAEIGRRMGVSKNAVVGKAHRLNLSPRPSPIRPANPSACKRPPARRPVPKLADIMPIMSAAQPVAASVMHAAPAASLLATAAPVTVTSDAPRPAQEGRTHPCCWPIGDPGTPAFRFCDADAPLGKPYCMEHASLAYTKARHRPIEADPTPGHGRAQLDETPVRSLRRRPTWDGCSIAKNCAIRLPPSI